MYAVRFNGSQSASEHNFKIDKELGRYILEGMAGPYNGEKYGCFLVNYNCTLSNIRRLSRGESGKLGC